jgi:transposase-like protein
MAMVGKVRGLYLRDRMSVSEIARRTSLSRNTVKRWLKGWEGKEPKYKRSEGPVKMTPFETVHVALKADALRPKCERRTARALYGQIRAQGYPAGTSEREMVATERFDNFVLLCAAGR